MGVTGREAATLVNVYAFFSNHTSSRERTCLAAEDNISVEFLGGFQKIPAILITVSENVPTQTSLSIMARLKTTTPLGLDGKDRTRKWNSRKNSHLVLSESAQTDDTRDRHLLPPPQRLSACWVVSGLRFWTSSLWK